MCDPLGKAPEDPWKSWCPLLPGAEEILTPNRYPNLSVGKQPLSLPIPAFPSREYCRCSFRWGQKNNFFISMFLFVIICLFTPVYKQKVLQEKKVMRKTQHGIGDGKSKLLRTGELFWNRGVLGIPHSNKLSCKILQTIWDSQVLSFSHNL